jgi:hypothetical protein
MNSIKMIQTTNGYDNTEEQRARDKRTARARRWAAIRRAIKYAIYKHAGTDDDDA